MKRLIGLVSLALFSSLSVAVLAENSTKGESTLQNKPMSEGCGVAPTPNGVTPEFESWQKRINETPQKYWQPYEFPKDRYCSIEFRVLRNGAMEDASVISSAWSIDADVSALEACWSSAPFSEPPAEYDLSKAATTPPNYDPSHSIIAGAKFSKSDINELFTGAIEIFKQQPSLKEKKFALHAIPLSVLDRYPRLFAKAELSSKGNVHLMDKDNYSYPASVQAYYENWHEFFLKHPKSSRSEIVDFAKKVTGNKALLREEKKAR